MGIYELSLWADDEENIKKIHSIACQIQTYTKRVVKGGIIKEQGEMLLNNMAVVLNYWTGSTYIGDRKSKQLEKAFQAFFKALYDFIIICRDNDRIFDIRRSDMILYRGTVYRYLGRQIGYSNDNSIIEPIYNDIYVSWSKKPKYTYIEGKLSYPITWMTAVIDEPYYGIDLVGLSEAINELIDCKYRIAIKNEQEVVFPTIKECITDIKYIERNYEEDNDE